MFNVGSFFEKFNSVALKELRLRESIIRSIKEQTTIEFDIKAIECKNSIIRFKASPLMKSQIFMKKTQILEGIKKDFPQHIFTDLQ